MQERIALVQQMQQIVYDESPYIPLVYPLDLEAANKGKWTGWVRANEDQGRLVVQHPAGHLPGGASRLPSASTESSGGSSTGVIIGSVIAAIFVIIIVVILLRRRGGRSETEM